MSVEPDLAPYLGRSFARGHWLSPARVLVVPPVPSSGYGPEDLLPSGSAMRALASTLSKLTARTVDVEPAMYLPVAVRATVVVDGARDEVERRLERFLHPLLGGPDGTGWPFGLAVRARDVAAALAELDVVVEVRELTLRAVDLAVPRRRAPERDTIDLPATGLVFGTGHELHLI
jgi:hypothetical protein